MHLKSIQSSVIHLKCTIQKATMPTNIIYASDCQNAQEPREELYKGRFFFLFFFQIIFEWSKSGLEHSHQVVWRSKWIFSGTWFTSECFFFQIQVHNFHAQLWRKGSPPTETELTWNSFLHIPYYWENHWQEEEDSQSMVSQMASVTCFSPGTVTVQRSFFPSYSGLGRKLWIHLCDVREMTRSPLSPTSCTELWKSNRGETCSLPM